MMPKPKFEIFKSSDNNQYYFRLLASNGRIICQSEGYTRKASALNGIKAVKRDASKAKVNELYMIK